MILKELKPRKALNKAFLKVKPNRTEIEGFKTNLITLLDRTNDTESEEFHKNLVSDFLKDTYYKQNHFINTKGRNDLVIHNGQNGNSTVGVILEAKKPTNKAEMITTKKLNVKAFQELVLYYLRERITHKNLEIKHLVATNINEWFIFDEHLFERLFAQNKSFVKQFENFEASKKTTEVFYKEIAEPFIADITVEIEFTYFNIQDFQKPLRNADKADDNSLIALFKLLSPEHLLKLPFTNDSNSLDKRFYSELLHIIGLSETKEGSKKLIGRNKTGERHTGTLLENAIVQLDSLDKLSRFEKPSLFGSTQQERLYSIALELSIIWINRILFLKLLEAQLITYHKGDKSHSFLNLDKIKNYDDLNSLFFQVLARKYDERNEDVKRIFEKVPYLNSSLFEPTDIEQVTLFISNLKDDKTIPVISSTVLKDNQGKKRTGNLTTLEYLFEFLNAYDFSSEGSEEIQEDNKTLINASVLGLIFEKINGYKDGSFFTPGFITMYMCHETIRKAVLQKFNETKKWNCTSIAALYDKIEDRKEANKIINGIKICDPAVGSGHFLVSALNEMIAVKNDLKILQDRDGKRLKEYQVEVVNDELIVTDEEGKLFEYNPTNKESQRIQETLFHEKQTIIENCLFGVDINSNSVKICRLRLWIELLKNAYYKNSTELETLPNIDINIKCGNSLVSRFAIDADLKQALKKSKWTIDSYRIAVDTYRNAESKEQKREMERLIANIKSDFRSEISMNDPKVKRLQKVHAEYFKLYEGKIFGNQKTDAEEKKKNKEKIIRGEKKKSSLEKEIESLTLEIKQIKENKIFENSFEWRFEFPEVLNDDGDFVGFDVVIGNPPYLRVESVSQIHANYYKKEYKSATGKFDVSSLFIELGISLINANGKLSYISTYQFIYTGSAKGLREFIMNNTVGRVIMFSSKQQIFEDATTYTGIFEFEKGCSEIFKIQKANVIEQSIRKSNVLSLSKSNFISKRVIVDDADISTKLKAISNTVLGHEIGVAKCGVVSSCDDVFFVQEKQISEFQLEKDLIYPILGSENLSRFHLSVPKTNCIYPYIENNNKTSLIDETQLKESYPNILNYFKTNETILRERSQGRVSYEKSNRWYQLNRPREKWIYDSIKIIAPGTTNNPKYALDLHGVVFRNARLYSFILKDENIEYYKLILGVLNSKLSHYLMTLLCPPKNNGYYELSTTFLEDFPYPIWSSNSEHQTNIISKVQEIISHKKVIENADTTLLELEIDQLVYKIYDLTPEEINIIETSYYK